MDLNARLTALSKLGQELHKTILPLEDQCLDVNPWFTSSEIRRATENWSEALSPENLAAWISQYNIGNEEPLLPVFVVTAGNIPLVGFHDFLSVLITGNILTASLSSRDPVLLPALAERLIQLEDGFSGRIFFESSASTPKGVIATGSGNTSRFFKRDFKSYPSIIRKNRTSVAIIDESTLDNDFSGIATDILSYYGLGCRSISHVFLQNQIQLKKLAEALKRTGIVDNTYMMDDNLRFQKARLKLSNIPYLDADNILLTGSSSIYSPIGIVNYSFYSDPEQLEHYLTQCQSDLQCITGSGHTKHGFAQKPALWDYSDQTDTINFLQKLKSGE